MPIDITSANSKLRIVIPQLFPAGFDVDDYAADAMFDSATLQNKEDMMSADGKYHAGYVFNIPEFTINLMPTSRAAALLDQVYAAEATSISPFTVNATLILTSQDNTKYNMVNGTLYSWPPIPSGRRVLQPRAAVFHFERITRS